MKTETSMTGNDELFEAAKRFIAIPLARRAGAALAIRHLLGKYPRALAKWVAGEAKPNQAGRLFDVLTSGPDWDGAGPDIDGTAADEGVSVAELVLGAETNEDLAARKLATEVADIAARFAP